MSDLGALALIRHASTTVSLPHTSIRVLGIDLGTTNSTVAELRWDPQEGLAQDARCLEVEQQTYEGLYTHVLVPSVVAMQHGKEIVGEGAKRLRARAPELGLRQNQDLFYDCKNDIGIQKTYHRAPEGFRSAAEIGGKVLAFLYHAALEYDPTPVQRVVVTVPASFQGSQRVDTVKAAGLAHLQLTSGALLDEPVAAFLDYVQTRGKTLMQQLVHPKKLVVFDFGGGTCDVAVFEVLPDRRHGPLQIAPLAVSRYHRLGGGDIDAAIVHDVLLPQLCEQNNLATFALGFEDKKLTLEPALLGIAEALKIGLCIEIQRLRSFEQYDREDKTQILKKQPGVHALLWKERTLALQGPSLSAAQFEELLKPFLDRDLLYARETEYRMTCSVFAPLQDALDRSGLAPQDVDYCLMVGGSSLIPQVQDAVKSYFTKARLLTYEDRDSVQVAVARGATYHALALELFGCGLVKAVTNEAIAIRSAAGLVPLIPKGTELPYPPDSSYRINRELAVPQSTLTGSCDLRVELVAGEAGEEERLLLRKMWKIPGLINQGAPLLLEYRMDENQVLDLRLTLAQVEDVEPFSTTIENPLTHVVNPHAKRLMIDQLEEDLRTGKIRRETVPEKMVELADAYADLGQREKAVEYLGRVLRSRNAPDAWLLNKMAIYCGQMGDFAREEKLYREAAAASSGAIPWFNLALSQHKRGLHAEAQATLDHALLMERKAPYLALMAQIYGSLDDRQQQENTLQEALRAFASVGSLDAWELGWFLTAARMAGDHDKLSQGEAELHRRNCSTGAVGSDAGVLPALTAGLQRVEQ